MVSVGFWSEVGFTRAIRLRAARRSGGLGRVVTLAHAVLGARRWLCARPVGPVCWSFGRSTMFLPFGCFSPCEEEGRGRRCAKWRVGGACAGYGCAVLLLLGGGQPSVGAGILVLTRSFDGLAGRDCERVMRNYFQVRYYLSDFTEVGVRAEGGRTQKPAQAGGGTQRFGTA